MCNNCNSKTEFSKTDCGCANTPALRTMLPYIHTQIMEKIGQHPDFPAIKPEAHYALVLREATKLFTNAGYQGIQFPSFETEFATISEIHATKPEEYLAKVVDEGKFSLQGGRILEEVLGILDSKMKPAQKVAAVRELNGFVENMLTLPAIEKNALLVALEIAVASLNFWQREMADRNSPYRRAARNRGYAAARLPWADIIGGGLNCLGCSGGGFVGCLGCASISSSLASSWFGAQDK